MSEGVIRIISDVHYGDVGGLQNLNALLPLFEGIDQLILNGDTLEARHENSGGLLSDVRGFVARAPVPVTFLAGNHDPEISPTMELTLHHGRVWTTHGDIFWEATAPWSRYASKMRRLVREERARRGIDEYRGSLTDLFDAHRSANIRGGPSHDPTERYPRARVFHLFKVVFPPTQVLQMLNSWQNGPGIALKWARRHRPDARFVVFGHIHFPGIWNFPSQDLVVVNTGSFNHLFGALCVDITPSSLRVRRIEKRGATLHAGALQREFPLAERAVSTLSASP